MKKILSIFLVMAIVFSTSFTTTVLAAKKNTLPKVKLMSVVASSSSSIKIKWKKATKVDGYIIYQKTGKQKFKKIKTITSSKTTSYTKQKLSSGKKYTYKIKAYKNTNKGKIYGVYSNTKYAYTKLPKAKLSSLEAVSCFSIKIKWKKVTNADGYIIYQKTGSGKFKKIKTITSGKTTSYTKKDLTDGKKYTYKIKAFKKINSKKIYGEYSKIKSLTLPELLVYIPSYDFSYNTNKTCRSAGCDNLPNKYNSYCSEHACAKSGCYSEKYFSSSFCYFHKCASSGCYNGRNTSGNYCSEHACSVANCFREKSSFMSNYCNWHKCNDFSCENQKKDLGSYCSEHECAYRWCTSKKSFMSDYCFLHDN